MTKATTLGLFYTGVALISIGIVSLAMYLGKGLNDPYQAPLATDTGKETAPQWFEIAKNLPATNQDSQAVKLSDLRGKVWVIAEFFSVCPRCAVRNGEELRVLYDEFKNHPDFHIACISVDPANDKPTKLADYAKALGADTKNWWFLNGGDTTTVHNYLEQELKFFGIRERKDPIDIEANGRYAHDLGFILVDRDFKVIGKWPLTDAGSPEVRKSDPNLYQKTKDELFGRIRLELNKKPATPKI